jgi:PAS domain S-box-containing protein
VRLEALRSHVDEPVDDRPGRIDSIVSRYAPAFIVVDQQGFELRRSTRVERYLAQQPPAAGGLAVRMVNPDMTSVLGRLLVEAAQVMRPVRARHVPYSSRGQDGAMVRHHVDLVVEPVSDRRAANHHRIILFIDVDDTCLDLCAGGLVTQNDLESASAFGGNQERLWHPAGPAGMETSFFFTTLTDLSVHDLTQNFYDITGLASGTGLVGGWEALLHVDDRAEHQRRWRAAAQQGGVFEQEHRLRTAAGVWRWFLCRAVPQHDAAGEVICWFGSSVDIDQRRRAELRQRYLLAEVQHRAKNILAVVRSLLSRTLESAVGLDDFAAHLSGRIAALARTQTALGRTIAGTMGLEELVLQEVVAQGGQLRDQVMIEGPPVMLADKMAETMGLALHELTTNALKFGALSVANGRVRVAWDLVIDPAEPTQPGRLRLMWEETGVKITTPEPARRGFGCEMIERGLPYELGARTKLQFRPRGLRCEIDLLLQTPPDGGPFASEVS